MATDNFTSVVGLRAGTILSVLAAADSAVAATMDGARDRFGRGRRNRVSNWLRNFFRAGHRAMGVAIRQFGFARRWRSAGVVWRQIARDSRWLVARADLFVDVEPGRSPASQRSGSIEISAGGTARSGGVCYFGSPHSCWI